MYFLVFSAREAWQLNKQNIEAFISVKLLVEHTRMIIDSLGDPEVSGLQRAKLCHTVWILRLHSDIWRIDYLYMRILLIYLYCFTDMLLAEISRPLLYFGARRCIFIGSVFGKAKLAESFSVDSQQWKTAYWIKNLVGEIFTKLVPSRVTLLRLSRCCHDYSSILLSFVTGVQCSKKMHKKSTGSKLQWSW